LNEDERGRMSRRWEAFWLVIGTGVCLAALPIGAAAALLSPMVFDPHKNLFNPAAWVAFLLIITFWIVCLAAPYGAWVAWFQKRGPLTWLAMAAPVVWALAAVTMMNFLHN
jgi:hypothetical protein